MIEDKVLLKQYMEDVAKKPVEHLTKIVDFLISHADDHTIETLNDAIADWNG